MSLNWNAEKIEGRENFTDDEFGVMDGLIWLTMAVGIHEITEKNYKEFHARLDIIQRLHGPYMNQGGKDYLITEEDVKRCIGLRTNASTLTRNQFNKSQLERFYRERGL